MENTKIDFNAILDDKLDSAKSVIDLMSEVFMLSRNNDCEHAFKIIALNIVSTFVTSKHLKVLINKNNSNNETLNVNLYNLVLMPSGTGKTYSHNLMMYTHLKPYLQDLRESILSVFTSNQNLIKKYLDDRDYSDVDNVLTHLNSLKSWNPEINNMTNPAIIQLMNAYKIFKQGNVNIRIDEIGINLPLLKESQGIILNADSGMAENKILKTTKNSEVLPISLLSPISSQYCPVNLLMTGVDGDFFTGYNEGQELNRWLQSGFARRLLFARNVDVKTLYDPTKHLVQVKKAIKHKLECIQSIFDKWTNNARVRNADNLITFHDDYCFTHYEDKKNDINKYITKIENKYAEVPIAQNISNINYRDSHILSLKIAAILADIHCSQLINEHHIDEGFKITKESNNHLQSLLSRPQLSERIYNYLYSSKKPVTKHSLSKQFPQFSGISTAAKKCIMDEVAEYAQASGNVMNTFKNKTSSDRTTEIFNIDKYKNVNLESISIDVSRKVNAHMYVKTDFTDTNNMHLLIKSGFSFSPFKNVLPVGESRTIDWQNNECFPEFIVLEVDKGSKPLEYYTDYLNICKYKYILYTTKSHTIKKPDDPRAYTRFRLIIPLKYSLDFTKLNDIENDDIEHYRKLYKQFYSTVIRLLRINAEQDGNTLEKHWYTFTPKGTNIRTNTPIENYKQIILSTINDNDKNLLDPLDFMPQSPPAIESIERYKTYNGYQGLTSWAIKSCPGQRHMILFRYGCVLVKYHMNAIMKKSKKSERDTILDLLQEVNSAIDNPLEDKELDTIVESLHKQYNKN